MYNELIERKNYLLTKNTTVETLEDNVYLGQLITQPRRIKL